MLNPLTVIRCLTSSRVSCHKATRGPFSATSLEVAPVFKAQSFAWRSVDLRVAATRLPRVRVGGGTAETSDHLATARRNLLADRRLGATKRASRLLGYCWVEWQGHGPERRFPYSRPLRGRSVHSSRLPAVLMGQWLSRVGRGPSARALPCYLQHPSCQVTIRPVRYFRGT